MPAPPPTPDLTPRQERAILALLAEPSVTAAAAAARVPESTLYRWLADPPFRDRLRAARRAVFEHGLGALAQATGEAVDVLRRALDNGDPAVEVKAALALLDRALRVRALADLEDEVEELKAELGRSRPPSAGG
jgi:hypothetical protein